MVSMTPKLQEKNRRRQERRANYNAMKPKMVEPDKRTITATGENVTGQDPKGIEEKILINKKVEEARFNEKVKAAIAADTTGTTSPEMTALEKQQVQELQTIDQIKSPVSQLSTTERNAAAGQAVGNVLLSNLGVEATQDPYAQAQQMGGIQKAVFGTVGIVATTGFGEWSLSSLFAPQSANIKNLQGDASAAKSESTRIMRAALTKGANINQAIDSQIRLEEGIRTRYNDAALSLRNSPKDIREGLDLLDDMSRDLRVVTENRQAMERFKLTQNPSEISLMAGTGIEEQQDAI